MLTLTTRTKMLSSKWRIGGGPCCPLSSCKLTSGDLLQNNSYECFHRQVSALTKIMACSRQHYFPKELFTGPGHTETVTHIRVRMFPGLFPNFQFFLHYNCFCGAHNAMHVYCFIVIITDGGISRIGILGNAQRVNHS